MPPGEPGVLPDSVFPGGKPGILPDIFGYWEICAGISGVGASVFARILYKAVTVHGIGYYLRGGVSFCLVPPNKEHRAFPRPVNCNWDRGVRNNQRINNLDNFTLYYYNT